MDDDVRKGSDAMSPAEGHDETTRLDAKKSVGLIRPATRAERLDIRAMHESNRTAWNEGAVRYTERLEETIEFIRAGGKNFVPVELDFIGDLRSWCRRAIHLQCASGRDTLSLWNLGAAEVVGIDISDVHIENARGLSQAVGAPAQWYRCDILDAPHELDGTADLVYTGRGAIVWLQDLKGWARVVARLLRPGGRCYIFDSHPISWLFEPETEHWEYAGYDYFSGIIEANKGWSPSYIGPLDRPDAELSWKYERLWTMAEIIQSLIDAGLRIDRFAEHSEDFWGGYDKIVTEERGRVPLTFSLLASRP